MNFTKDGYTSNGILWRKEVVFLQPKGHRDEGQIGVRVILVRNSEGRLIRVEHPSPRSRYARPVP